MLNTVLLKFLKKYRSIIMPRFVATFVKTPKGVLDYTFDWTKWLDALPDSIDSITTEEFGATVDSADVVGKMVPVFVSGGVRGGEAIITCNIVTNNDPPRQDSRSIRIKIV
jgi:hypothetical protein